jgi:translation initiation factor IF-2
MRVFELAKELKIPIKELMELVEMEGIVVQNHFAALTPAQVRTLKIAAGAEEEGENEDSAEEADVSPPAPEPVVAEVPSIVEVAPEPEAVPEPAGPPRLEIFGDIVIKELAARLDAKPNVLIAALMKMNVFASINQSISKDVARKLAEAQGFVVITEAPKVKPPPPAPLPPPVPVAPAPSSEANVSEETTANLPEADAKTTSSVFQPKELKEKEKKKKEKSSKPAATQAVVGSAAVTRPPVVTFMGHVDHGKTSLLDNIRKANVVAGEAGGITQHIGAYTVSVDGREITFLDTPGHAAFSAMRARGATVTDIVVIIISAEESIKPQTLEAIKHAQDAGVTLMVAINKIDLPKANIDRVKQDMQRNQIPSEDWGGSTVTVPVSAVTGQGIDELLSMILLQAEVLDLKAIPTGSASGFVVEAELEKGMGPTASVLVTEGLLHVGDVLLCGEACGKIKALIDPNGKRVKSAGPSHAVKIIGLSDVPSPGDRFEIVKTEKEARERSAELKGSNRISSLQGPARGLTLDDLFAQAGMDEVEELRIILKSDVKGSQEAIATALMDIKSDKVRLKMLGTGVGPINENDVLRAHAANAVIIGFNVNQENAAVKAAKAKGVDIQLYDIIYELIDEVKAAMLGLLKPVVQERVIGHAEIRVLFKLTKGGNVAGCIVTDGRMRARARARVFRGKDVIYKGGIATLKRFQDEVSEVGNGQECGIRLENFDDFEAGDVVEAFINENVKQDL